MRCRGICRNGQRCRSQTHQKSALYCGCHRRKVRSFKPARLNLHGPTYLNIVSMASKMHKHEIRNLISELKNMIDDHDQFDHDHDD